MNGLTVLMIQTMTLFCQNDYNRYGNKNECFVRISNCMELESKDSLRGVSHKSLYNCLKRESKGELKDE